MIETRLELIGKISAREELNGTLNETIKYVNPITQEKTITPSLEQQVITPDSNYTGLSKVTIEAVTNEVDNNIQPNNIKLGVSILGVEGNVEPDKPDQTKEATPTKEVQTITPDTGYELSQVTINPIPDEYVIPNGEIEINSNGIANVGGYASANVNVQPNLQSKNAIPSEETQNITADEDYDGLSNVVIEPIPSEYIKPTGTLDITSNGSYDVKNYENANVNVGGIEITNANHLFYNGARIDAADALINAISPNCEIFSQMFMSYKGTEIPMFNCSNGKNFTQIFASCSNITTIPQIDTSNCENFNSAFQGCSSLEILPPLNLSKCTTIESTFSGCSKLTSIPAIDTSKIQFFERAFYQCSKLSTIDLDLSSATDADNMFYQCNALTSAILRNSNLVTSFSNLFSSCGKLTTVQLNTDSATYLNSLFSSCSALTDIPLLNCENVTSINNMFWACSKLTNLGGFKDLGKAYLTTSAANYNNYMLDISKSSLITHDSMMNIINNVYDIATKGCKSQKIKVNSTVLGRLSEEEIAIATNKGWTVATS